MVVVAADLDIGHYQVVLVLLGKVIMVVMQVQLNKDLVAVEVPEE